MGSRKFVRLIWDKTLRLICIPARRIFAIQPKQSCQVYGLCPARIYLRESARRSSVKRRAVRRATSHRTKCSPTLGPRWRVPAKAHRWRKELDSCIYPDEKSSVPKVHAKVTLSLNADGFLRVMYWDSRILQRLVHRFPTEGVQSCHGCSSSVHVQECRTVVGWTRSICRTKEKMTLVCDTRLDRKGDGNAQKYPLSPFKAKAALACNVI